jgi:hypothetical protein
MGKETLDRQLIRLGVFFEDEAKQDPHVLFEGTDELSNQRRKKIETVLTQRFAEKSLRDRLNPSHFDASRSGDYVLGRNLDRGSRGFSPHYVANVLREGLLGVLPDKTLLRDLAPQGEGEKLSKITEDPLWKHMDDLLSVRQKANVIHMFEVIDKYALKLEDQATSSAVSRRLQHDRLITLGDARKVPREGWLSLAGFGVAFANIMVEAVKKV